MKIALPAKAITKHVQTAKCIMQTATTAKNMAAIVKVAVLVAASIVKKNKESAKENAKKSPAKRQGFFITIPFLIDRTKKDKFWL